MEALLINPEAKESCVHFFSDAAAKVKDQAKVEAVRSYIRSVQGFKEVHIHDVETILNEMYNSIAGRMF